jgi:leader peptidase (prepilin peptidase)/N-methyltransferase
MAIAVRLAEFLAFTLFMVPAAYVDSQEKRIPDVFLVGAGVVLAALRLLSRELRVEQLLGAGVGLLVLLGVWLAARNKLGLGDVKLSALTGFFLGVWGWALALFAASLTGAIYVLVLSARTRGASRTPIAFGPFFVGGAVLAFILLPVLEELIPL